MFLTENILNGRNDIVRDSSTESKLVFFAQIWPVLYCLLNTSNKTVKLDLVIFRSQIKKWKDKEYLAFESKDNAFVNVNVSVVMICLINCMQMCPYCVNTLLVLIVSLILFLF